MTNFTNTLNFAAHGLMHARVLCLSHTPEQTRVRVQEFAVGVVSKNGEYRLIDSGALPEAVAASAAIPFVFEPVNVPGQPSTPFCFVH